VIIAVGRVQITKKKLIIIIIIDVVNRRLEVAVVLVWLALLLLAAISYIMSTLKMSKIKNGPIEYVYKWTFQFKNSETKSNEENQSFKKKRKTENILIFIYFSPRLIPKCIVYCRGKALCDFSSIYDCDEAVRNQQIRII
jgi:hypothetical protein